MLELCGVNTTFNVSFQMRESIGKISLKLLVLCKYMVFAQE